MIHYEFWLRWGNQIIGGLIGMHDHSFYAVYVFLKGLSIQSPIIPYSIQLI